MLVPSDSILLIDKPLHWSSFDVIRYLKKQYRLTTPESDQIKRFKIGHAGTLDPLATGLLVICTGKLTKQINLYQAQTKEYIATLRLGGITPSYDAEFAPDHLRDTSLLTESQLIATLEQFCGTINQTPPLFSAVKVDGKRAYSLARQNLQDTLDEEIKGSGTYSQSKVIQQPLPTISSRTVLIDTIELIPRSWKEINEFDHEFKECRLRIICGKGTYIRSLARDIGEALGCGGYLTGLQRTRIGDFFIADARTINASEFVPYSQRNIVKK